MANILVKFATRSRPQKFAGCIANLINNAAQPDKMLILVSIDEDDLPMVDIMKQYEKAPANNIQFVCGHSKNKIDAINRDVNECAYDWDILINYSDDQEFVMQGYDDVIREQMKAHFPNGDGVLHFRDQAWKKMELMAMSIMDRKYYNRFGYIYYPEYASLFADDDALEVARKLNRYKYIGDDTIIFNHLHPGYGKGEMDIQYRKTEAFYQSDEQIFIERSKKNFGL